MRITWTLAGSGWAGCTLEDHQAKVVLTAASITSTPEEFLTAAARLVAVEPESRTQFDAVLTAYRWIFYREGVSDHAERRRSSEGDSSCGPGVTAVRAGGGGDDRGLSAEEVGRAMPRSMAIRATISPASSRMGADPGTLCSAASVAEATPGRSAALGGRLMVTPTSVRMLRSSFQVVAERLRHSANAESMWRRAVTPFILVTLVR